MHVIRGDFASARSSLPRARELSTTSFSLFFTQLAAAEVALHDGDLPTAEDEAQRGIEEQSTGMPALVPPFLRLLARIAGELETWAEAARLLAAGLTLPGAAETAHEREHDERLKARLRQELGDEAFEEAWQQGAAMTLEEAVAYARRGRGERKRPSSGWASLTPTELLVAELVAEGLSNPAIGERLFISSCTLGTHLTHIFAKLGFGSRAELAAEVSRRRLSAD